MILWTKFKKGGYRVLITTQNNIIFGNIQDETLNKKIYSKIKKVLKDDSFKNVIEKSSKNLQISEQCIKKGINIYDKNALHYVKKGKIFKNNNTDFLYCILPFQKSCGAVIVMSTIYSIKTVDKEKHGFFRYAITMYHTINNIYPKHWD